MPIRLVHLTPAIVSAALLCSAAAFAQTPANTSARAATPATSAHTATSDHREGTFKAVQGDVTLVRGNARSAATVGDALHTSDRVLTGPSSAASVTLRDGTVLSIGPDSSVDLSEFRFDTTTHDGNVLIGLARGSLRLVTGLIAKLKPEQVKVTTPTTVIGVRGTDFIVEQR